MGGAAGMTGAEGMSPIDRLIARDEIRQQIALFALLADGDGVRPKDTRALADRIMAPDVVVEIFRPGDLLPITMLGRAAVAGPPLVAPPAEPTVARHYMVETYFEELTSGTARTITTAVHFRLTRASDGIDGGLPTKITMVTYHMTWRKAAEGWLVTYNGLHADN